MDNGGLVERRGMNIYTAKETTIKPKHIRERILTARKCDLCQEHFKVDVKGEWLIEDALQFVRKTRTNLCLDETKCHPRFTGVVGSFFSLDICPYCFRNKLVPWLESEGVNVKQFGHLSVLHKT